MRISVRRNEPGSERRDTAAPEGRSRAPAVESLDTDDELYSQVCRAVGGDQIYHSSKHSNVYCSLARWLKLSYRSTKAKLYPACWHTTQAEPLSHRLFLTRALMGRYQILDNGMGSSGSHLSGVRRDDLVGGHPDTKAQ